MAWGDINPAVQQPRDTIVKAPILGTPTVSDPYWYGASAVLPSGMAAPASTGASPAVAAHKSHHTQILMFMLAFFVAAILVHRMVTGNWSIINGMLIGLAGGIGVEVAKSLSEIQAGPVQS